MPKPLITIHAKDASGELNIATSLSMQEDEAARIHADYLSFVQSGTPKGGSYSGWVTSSGEGRTVTVNFGDVALIA